MSNPTTIKLDYPIKVNGVEADELKMRRAKVRDHTSASKITGNDAEQENFLFANLCSITTEEYGSLDVIDLAKVQKQYKDFLKPRRKQ